MVNADQCLGKWTLLGGNVALSSKTLYVSALKSNHSISKNLSQKKKKKIIVKTDLNDYLINDGLLDKKLICLVHHLFPQCIAFGAHIR